MRKKIKALSVKYKILLMALIIGALALTLFTPDNVDNILIVLAQAAILLVGK